MSSASGSTYEQRQTLRRVHLDSNDAFVSGIPKVELHVHIEGTLTPSLRWELSRRNSIPLTVGSDKTPLTSLQQVEEAYTQIRGRIGAASAHGKTNMTFFEAYCGRFSLFQSEQDYYDLAIGYFQHAAEMNVIYCEPFLDLQGHTRRGVRMDVIMNGFKRAQEDAEERLNVSSESCFEMEQLLKSNG
jgi:adenosine deaminase